MLFGFALLAGYRKTYGRWDLAGVAYNSGPGTAAKGTVTDYGRTFSRHVTEWRARLVAATPAHDVPAPKPPLPPAPPRTYVVKAGDTLSGIAKRYDTTVPALVKLNALPDPNRIAVGRTLRLP